MRHQKFPKDEIDKLFHIRKDRDNNRIIPICPALDDLGQFHIWVLGDDKILELKGEPIEQVYFAKKQHSDSDFYFEFLNYMYQRATSVDILKLLDIIRNDVYKLTTCLAKIELYHKLKNKQDIEIHRFVETEVEYLFVLCRRLYDLLQKVACNLWRNNNYFKKCSKNQLNYSFSRMVLNGDNLLTKEELQQTYGLIPAFALFYVNEAPFFKILRNYRNKIIHSGFSMDYIYGTEKGFACHATSEPFSSFNVWNNKTFLPNNLAPLNPVLAHIIGRTLCAMNHFVDIMKKEKVLSDEIAPGYSLFMKGYHTDKLSTLPEMVHKEV